MRQRLHKLMAGAGVASRRRCEEMIAAGRVSVNGQVVRAPGVSVDPSRDAVAVDGKPLPLVEGKQVYIAVNKPPGYVTTVRDPQGRPTVLSLVPVARERLYPVGRLDMESEGLLLLTNDGELAQVLTHPRYGVEREYLVEVKGMATATTLAKLESGLVLEGRRTSVVGAQLLRAGERDSCVKLVVREGRKRMIRKMFAALGHPVIRLRRTRIGPLVLGGLKPGGWRYLTRREMSALQALKG